MKRSRLRDEALSRIFATRGSMSRFAERIGKTPAAVSLWRRCPEEYLSEMVKFSGVPAGSIRPDLAALFEKKQKKLEAVSGAV